MRGWDWISAVFMLCGCFFFAAGAVGMLRFPDVYTRLHALTKADNLGLGFIVLGLLPQADSLPAAMKLVLIWVVGLSASVTASHIVANAARDEGIEPWQRERR